MPEKFAELIEMIAEGKISSSSAKSIMAFMVEESGSSPRVLAEKHNLLQKSDAADIEPIIEKVVRDNPTVVAEYKAGKVASLQFLIGQAMKVTKGAANPTVLRELMVKKLS